MSYMFNRVLSLSHRYTCGIYIFYFVFMIYYESERTAATEKVCLALLRNTPSSKTLLFLFVFTRLIVLRAVG